MDLIEPRTHQHDKWNKAYLSAGPVGQLGGTLQASRLKHSQPDLPIRWDPFTDGNRECRFGSNVQDGNMHSYEGGFVPRLLDHNWELDRTRTDKVGYVFQNLEEEDMRPSSIAMTGPVPQYAWRTQVANTYKSLAQNDAFLPVPGPYVPDPSAIPRGGLVPQLQAVVDASNPYLTVNPNLNDTIRGPGYQRQSSANAFFRPEAGYVNPIIGK